MHELWYDYIKPKYQPNAKLCYIGTDSLIIADDVEERFDASNYEIIRPWPTSKNKKVIGLMKDELGS